MAEENLQLNINVGVTGAEGLKDLTSNLQSLKSIGSEKDISGLSSTLENINNAIKKISGSGSAFNSLTKSLEKLPNAIKNIGNIGSGDIDNASKSLGNFNKTLDSFSGKGSSIANAAQGLSKLPEAIRGISDFTASTDYESNMDYLDAFIKGLDNSISGFSKEGSKVAASLANIGDSFKEFAKLNDADYFDNIIEGMDNAAVAIQDFAGKLTSAIPDDVLAKFVSLGKAIEQITTGMSKLGSATNNAQGLSKSLNGLGASSKSLDSLGNISNIFDSIGATGGKSIWGDVFSIAAGGNPVTAAISIGKKISSTFEQIMSTMFKDISDMAEATGIPKALNEISASFSNMFPVIGEFVQIGVSGFDDFWKSISQGDNALHSFENALKSVAKTAIRFATAIAAMPFKKFIIQVTEATKQVKNLGRIMGLSVLYSAVFKGISFITKGLQESVTNLYYWAQVANDPFASTMDSLATSMQYFKNSVGAMVSPLLDALAPAIEYVTNAVVRLINAINQLFSALTGHSTWRKAVRQQKAFATATGASSKAAKELKKTILSFDEIHQLNDNKNSSGGGGASTPDYGSMFETAPIDDFYKKLSKTDDWTALGKKVADGINSWMDGIDWDGINKTAQTWSKRIWTSFNGFIDELHWDTLGDTIGKGINVALHFIDDIFQNTHWTTLGKNLGIMLNHEFATIDWVALGHVFTDGFKAIFETLHGFMQTFDWDSFRDDLRTTITAAFNNLDLDTAAIDLSNLAKEILDTLIAVVDAIPWDEIGEALKKVDWKGILARVFRLICEIVKGLAESGLLEVIMPFIGMKIGESIGGLVGFPEIGGAIGLLAGFVQGKMIDAFAQTDWNKIGDDFSSGVIGICETIGQPIIDTFEAAKDVTKKGWDAITTVFSLGVQFIENLFKFFLEILEIPVNFVKENFGPQIEDGMKKIQGVFEDVWGKIEDVVETVTGAISKVITDVWDKITGVTTIVWNAIKSVVETVWNGLKETATTLWTNIKDAIMTPINVVKKGVEVVWYGLKTTLEQTWDGLKTTATTIWEGITDAIKKPIEKARDVVHDAIEKIKEFFNFKIEWPKIKMPHFTTSGKFGINPPSVPEFHVEYKANGGLVDNGQLFVAREAGPEMIGSLGSHPNAVANNEDIVSGIRQGVSDANSQEIALLKQMNENLLRLLDKDVVAQITTGQITSALKQQNQRFGTTVVPVS